MTKQLACKLCLLFWLASVLNQNVSAQTTIYFSYDNAGNVTTYYDIKVQTMMATTATDSTFDFMKSGVIEKSEKEDTPLQEMQLQVYPNPTTGQIFIHGIASTDTKLTMYSLQGKILIQYNSTQERESIDMANLPVGIYILTVEGTEQKQMWKIIKE